MPNSLPSEKLHRPEGVVGSPKVEPECCDSCLQDDQVSTKWTNVGEGRGQYMLVPGYQHVGEGRGEYDVERVRTFKFYKPKIRCVCCGVVLILLGLFAVLYHMEAQVLHRHDEPLGDPFPCTWTSGTATTVMRTLIEAAWRCADSDQRAASVSESCQELLELAPVAQKLSKGDRNGNGLLDREEFEAALADDSSAADALWFDVDANHDGKVDEQELHDAERRQLLPATLVAMLLAADADSDGTLGRKEFLSVARPYTEGRGIEDAKAAWSLLDGNGDGLVNDQRLTSIAAWAKLPPQMLLQLIPAGASSLSKDDFLSSMVALPSEEWPLDQQTWCCHHRGMCFSTTTTPVPSEPLRPQYDCHVGYDDWWHRWDYRKQVWCCTHYARGCPHGTFPPSLASSAPFDCSAGYANWRRGWSAHKKTWCCRHANRACFMYNCSRSEDWLTDWTFAKKEWCCKHAGTGCLSSTSLAFDCHAGFSNWRAGWSNPKKAWCCKHYDLACAKEPFDCSAGSRNWQNGWSAEKKEWCCNHHHVGCKNGASHTFNCSATDVTWSPRKQAWCCLHLNLGCPDDDDDFNCGVGYHHWRSHWSEGKKAWCCKHYHRGCDFNCSLSPTWKTSWSPERKAWCCQHKGSGCPGDETPRYDCSTGSSWPSAKQEWCCKHEQRGCGAMHELYNCSGTSQQSSWSDQRKDWCCRHHRLGCEYDCSDFHLQEGWSSSQREWCCDHMGFGCSR
ncbi:Calmodulin-4 [Symbiodinium microadriaticum]|uniref:Calmodulin-4 n=1 Tax=Symbiodinium microadriaticum TaxID=2951 RepID=A0A1Q9C3P3_SYMMI|nr:Calmodulin-4 [Symbiodinium microadriaticum]CAE7614906.1 Calm4 [Symbiodinium microadriaticum]CAE7683212.1 Calm4 [Symbiodinium sp. KB8]